jgi:MoaA/NifB/PqqE/SkfB family radical SAM enzyme
MAGIRTLYVHVTQRCNLHCAYCYCDCGPASTGELDARLVPALAEEVVRLRAERVVLTGGEPLLWPQLFESARILREACDEIGAGLRLATNGMLVDESLAAEIASVFSDVRVSIDGLRDVNDSLRGPGTFEGACSAIRRFFGAGISPAVSVVASTPSLPGLPDFLRYLRREVGVAEIHVSVLRPVGRAKARPDLVCGWQDANRATAEFWSAEFQPAHAIGAHPPLDCVGCGIGDHLNIATDGGVYPCHVLTGPHYRLGTLGVDSLSEAARHAADVGASLVRRFSEARQSRPGAEILDEALCAGEALQALHSTPS